jgi:hypothetical protein
MPECLLNGTINPVLKWSQETPHFHVIPGISGLNDPGGRIRLEREVDLLCLHERTQLGIATPYSLVK